MIDQRDGYIIEDPSEFVESIRKTAENARRPFTVSEIRKTVDVADKEWRSLVLFGLYAGQRLADLATLRWDNIDLARNEIRIKTRKTGKRLAIRRGGFNNRDRGASARILYRSPFSASVRVGMRLNEFRKIESRPEPGKRLVNFDEWHSGSLCSLSRFSRSCVRPT